ncbi:MAG: flagellar hook-basal body complex protein FliE [Ignavibacteriaceae bacterium]
MKIGEINSILPSVTLLDKTEKPNNTDFKNVLTDFIGDVNKSQIDSDNITNDFIVGKNVELQDVMISAEKAKTSLELLMEIRNKTIDMYKELTNMPI